MCFGKRKTMVCHGIILDISDGMFVYGNCYDSFS